MLRGFQGAEGGLSPCRLCCAFPRHHRTCPEHGTETESVSLTLYSS